MVNSRYITAEDIDMFYTGAAQHPFMLHGDLLELTKTAGTTATSVTGVLNKVYGALIWAQLNQEANVFGMLPKSTWIRSGWRVKTAMGTSVDTDLSLSETSALPNSVYPTLELVSMTPKIQVLPFDVTDVVEALSSVSADDIWGAAHQIRAEIGTEFVKLLNQQLTHIVAETNQSATGDTRGNSFETIDRIVSKTSEVGFSTSYEKVYGIDKTSKPWANAYVDDASAGRDLTDGLVRKLLMNTRKRGANTNVLLTGYDTYASLLGMYMSFVRYRPMSETKAQFGVGGVQSANGLETGINIASLYDIPLVQSVDVGVSSQGTIANIYALDTTDPEGYGYPRLGLSILRPSEYFETRDYVLLNKFVVRGVYRMVGELTGRFLFGQGKLRDIK
jgi:hypothetical protein